MNGNTSSDSSDSSPRTKKSKSHSKQDEIRLTDDVKSEDSDSSSGSTYTVFNSSAKIPRNGSQNGEIPNPENSEYDNYYVDLTNPEIRSKYKDLIEECEQFSAIEGVDETLLEDMSKNIREGNGLSRYILKADNVAESKEKFWSYSHTKAFTAALRVKTENMKNSSSVFSLDNFIHSMKNRFTNDLGDFGAAELKDELAWQLGYAGQIVPAIELLLGTFDKTKIAKVNTPLPAKEKTIRATPLQKKFSNANCTKHEVVTKEKEKKKDNKESADMLSKSILEVLKTHRTKESEPLSFVEFSFDKTSLARTVENMFCTGFLARDGCVSISRSSGSKLVVEPKKPPAKDVAQQPIRQQFIWSFTPQQWKKLAQEATGDNIIPTSLSKN